MTELLGFDPDLLAAFRAALVRAVDDLRTIRSPDPTAAAAVDAVRHARGAIELQWIPLVDRVLASPALAPWGGRRGGGWLQAEDPLAPVIAGVAARQLVRDALASGGPDEAALVLASLAVDAATLGELTFEILATWRAGRPGGLPWDDHWTFGANVADRLLPALAERPLAAARFLELAAASPEVLFVAAEDEAWVGRVLAAGTAPGVVDARAAGDVLVPLLRWLQGHDAWRLIGLDGATPGARVHMAEAVAPWLLRFGRRAAEWGWSREEADAALRWVADDERAAERLVVAHARWQASVAGAPLVDGDGRIDADALFDLAGVMSQLQRVLQHADIDAAAEDRAWLDLSLRGAAAVVSIASSASGAGPVTSLAAGAVTAQLGQAARRQLDAWGVVPTEERSRRRARATFGTRVADTAVIAVVAVVGHQVDRGLLPAHALDRLHLDDLRRDDDGDDDACTAREVIDRLEAYVAEVAPSTTPEVANALTAVLAAFGAPGSVDAAC